VLTGAGTGKFYPRGDGDGRLIPDGEFPVAIPRDAPGCVCLSAVGNGD
jgi:hypothetical protein